jgi:hypothetical protein
MNGCKASLETRDLWYRRILGGIPIQLAFRNRFISYKLDDRRLAPREFIAEVRSDHAGAAAQDDRLRIGCRVHLESMDGAVQSRLLRRLLERV